MEDASVLPFSEWAAWVSELAARARASIVGSEGLDWYGMRMLARWDPVVRFHELFAWWMLDSGLCAAWRARVWRGGTCGSRVGCSIAGDPAVS
jgi:hypothetical protein